MRPDWESSCDDTGLALARKGYDLMLTVLRNTWALLLGMLLLMLGNGMQGTLLGIRASILWQSEELCLEMQLQARAIRVQVPLRCRWRAR